MAALLCIGRATAYKLAHQADFPSFRRGRSVRVRKDDLDEWIERKKEAGGRVVTQASSILLWILGLLATGFGAGLFAGIALARKWRRQREEGQK